MMTNLKRLKADIVKHHPQHDCDLRAAAIIRYQLALEDTLESETRRRESVQAGARGLAVRVRKCARMWRACFTDLGLEQLRGDRLVMLLRDAGITEIKFHNGTDWDMIDLRCWRAEIERIQKGESR